MERPEITARKKRKGAFSSFIFSFLIVGRPDGTSHLVIWEEEGSLWICPDRNGVGGR